MTHIIQCKQLESEKKEGYANTFIMHQGNFYKEVYFDREILFNHVHSIHVQSIHEGLPTKKPLSEKAFL